MRPLSLILACVAGAGLGFSQIRLTMRLMKKPNIWLAVAKLPLWALPMLAAACFSVYALLSLTAGASATYLGYVLAGWRRLRKGDGN
jgi:hypothetical protein